jgi:hypothetical protein
MVTTELADSVKNDRSLVLHNKDTIFGEDHIKQLSAADKHVQRNVVFSATNNCFSPCPDQGRQDSQYKTFPACK